ncbi:hypothetical protein GCM10011609_27230 [Lentzea pudingi]|uniref:Uncharacterized protein n=1 Tax=Lentzea pudingi TaxID=1789439 RepID=A0ABQ2HSR4_9PSEU|nr:hypothetical protein [Lentzea pudingi]GGM88973.1 hypothetical protein GCM10011609_27230 [Lentzea pudingi]
MYDGPLDDVATNVRTKSGRLLPTGRRLANSPVVRACLEGGRRLAEQELLGFAGEEHLHRPLDTLTQKNIAREAELIFQEALRDEHVAHALFGTPPDWKKAGTRPSVGTMKDRWPTLALYMGDLVRYVLRERYSLTDGMLDEAARAELRETAAFSAAVDKVAYHDMKIVYADETSARFQYLVTALTDFHKQIREALDGVYEHSFGYWRDLYAEILEARGVSLRPGISLNELTMMLTGMAQGLSLRHIGAAGGKVIDHANQRCLLGKASQILIAGAIDPGDGRKVADVVDELMAVRVPVDEDRRKPRRFRARVRRLRRGKQWP